MTIERKLLSTSPSGGATDVADVFSTDLYDGKNSSQTINNGIDLAGEGGMVWQKLRVHPTPPDGQDHYLRDTVRGGGRRVYSNKTNAQNGDGGGISSFNSNGFSIGNVSAGNLNGAKYVTWTFRNKKKFFDVVTYTGNGVAGRTVAHNLGGPVGMMLVKCTSHAQNWAVWHKSMQNTHYLRLNSTNAQNASSTYWNNTTPTDTVFTVGTAHEVNVANKTYVAYLFADNSAEDAEDQMIKCGLATTVSGNKAVVNLGWEPQFLLIKKSNSSGDWIMQDTMRGLRPDGSGNFVYANSDDPEVSQNGNSELTSTGFTAVSNGIGHEFIWMAIRGPMMVEPEAATEVFAVSTRGSSAATADGVVYHSNFPVDMTLAKNVTYQGGSVALYNRSRGDLSLFTDTNAVEASQGGSKWDSMHGFDVRTLSASTANMAWMWKKAKGFMDVVCYRGSGNAGNVINGYHTHTIPHSLGVIPELVIIKNRATNGQPWQVASPVGNGFLSLNETDPYNSNVSRFRNKHLWSDTTFNVVGAGNVINASGAQYVAQLFATLAGVSKVGTFTGSGSSSQTIDCGFSAGARFIMIKRTDSDGTWFMWDYVRGIASGNEPWLGLNNNNAHTTNTDIIDPHNSGFIIRPTQGQPNNMNVSSATYLFYAIA